MIAPDYQDRWGYDRESLGIYGRAALRAFTRLEVDLIDLEVTVEGDRGRGVAIVRARGEGPPEVTVFVAALNSSFVPTRFDWHRASWKPWDWQLVSLDHPEIEAPRSRMPW
jgi:hypothetical protein